MVVDLTSNLALAAGLARPVHTALVAHHPSALPADLLDDDVIDLAVRLREDSTDPTAYGHARGTYWTADGFERALQDAASLTPRHHR